LYKSQSNDWNLNLDVFKSKFCPLIDFLLILQVTTQAVHTEKTLQLTDSRKQSKKDLDIYDWLFSCWFHLSIYGMTIVNKLHHPWQFPTVSTDFSHTNNVIYGYSRTSSMMKFSKAKKKLFLYYLRSEKHCSSETSYFWVVSHRTSIFQLLNLLSLLGKGTFLRVQTVLSFSHLLRLYFQSVSWI